MEGNLATFREIPNNNGTAVKRFEMIAYTGAAMDAPLLGRVIVDLKGINANGAKKPILRDHNSAQIVGYSDSIEKDKHLAISGTISAKTAAGREVSDLADEGFPWQASMGINIQRIEHVAAGDSVEVNGAEFAGPGVVIRQSVLKESSFVPLGADGATSAVVFSDDGGFIDLPTKEFDMSITIDQFKAFAADHPEAVEGYVQQGYEKAKAELTPKPALVADLKAAFAGHRDFVLDIIDGNPSMEQAKAKFADHAIEQIKAKDAKIAELEAKLAKSTDGQAGVGFTASASANVAPDDSDPRAVAEYEWDNKPELRQGFSSKETYTFYRMNELAGRVKILKRDPDKKQD